MKKNLQPITFPCEFEIKVMGKSNPKFEEKVLKLISKNCPIQSIKKVTRRPSKKGNFLALSVVIYTESKAQLDLIYQDLSSDKEILMAL